MKCLFTKTFSMHFCISQCSRLVAKWRARQKNWRALKLYFFDCFYFLLIKKFATEKYAFFGNFLKNKCVGLLTEIEKSGYSWYLFLYDSDNEFKTFRELSNMPMVFFKCMLVCPNYRISFQLK